MASTVSFPRSLAKSYLTFRNFQNKCINASSFASTLFYFYRPHSQNPHLQLSLYTGRLLAHYLSRASSPSLRRSLWVMATPQVTSDSKESSTKTERVVIKGRVQGVWYRNWTIDNATQLGLKGWVRNRKDGSTERTGLWRLCSPGALRRFRKWSRGAAEARLMRWSLDWWFSRAMMTPALDSSVNPPFDEAMQKY